MPLVPSGPLQGLKVMEFAGKGPGPFACMMLSDMGASVLRIERKGAVKANRIDERGRHTIALDLKDSESVDICLNLIESADFLVEGYRPGVMERLGLGPEAALARNPKLIYGRITGWGQGGPLADTAGHDINYLALTGALHAIGTEEKPVPPLNLAADYGGGAMFLVAGLLAALHHATMTGKGQVVDAAMVDGAAYLMTLFYGNLATGTWEDRRNANILDGGAHFYDTYRCADDKWVALGSIEPQFYALLLKHMGIEMQMRANQMDPKNWPMLREVLAAVFATRSRDEWCRITEGTDACLTPVLSMTEAPWHPHHRSRDAFIDVDGITQPAPAPRFSVTPSRIQAPPAPIGDDMVTTLAAWRGEEA